MDSRWKLIAEVNVNRVSICFQLLPIASICFISPQMKKKTPASTTSSGIFLQRRRLSFDYIFWTIPSVSTPLSRFISHKSPLY